MYGKMSLGDNKMIRKVVFSAILLLVLLVTSIPLIACSGTTETGSPGYFLETLTKRGVSFSFEYPDDYEKNETIYEEESDELDYIVLQYMASTDYGTYRKIISIQLWNPTTDWQDAVTRMDYYLDNLGDTAQESEVKERSSMQVAGVAGEKAVFSMVVTDITDIPNNLTGWIASFDYKEQIWFLVVTTNMEATDEAEADFVHLIESFKFPD
jgi:hypothetical protein